LQGARRIATEMDIADWRKKIDEIDEKLVELLNERARAACAIGEIKRVMQKPVYEPTRETEIFEHIRRINPGALPDRELMQVFERIIDVMRQIQRDRRSQAKATGGNTELEAEVND
jgi:chorismate mutase